MIFRISIVLGYLTLAGCVVAPTGYDSDPDEFEAVPGTHGIVVFQGVTMDPRLNEFMWGWHSVRTSRLGGPPMTWLKKGEAAPLKYNVYPDYGTLPGTTLWVGVLPAGNYLLEDFYSSFNNGQYYGHLAVSVADSVASFTIEPGKVTVLDTYLYKGFGGKHLTSNVAPRTDLVAAAKLKYPGILAGVDTSAPLGFTAAGVERGTETSERMMSWAHTVGASEFANDGRIFRGARAGQIFERLPQGTWKRHSLPSFQSVQSVEATENGEVVAILGSGDAYWRKSPERDFERVPLTFEGELQGLSQVAGEWFASVVRTSNTVDRFDKKIATHELDLMKAPSLDGPWELYRTLPVEKPYAAARRLGDKVIVGNPDGMGKIFDVKAGREIELPAGFAYVRSYADGTVLGSTAYERGFWSGIASSELWISRDYGSTWTELPDVAAKGMPEHIGDGEVLLVGKRVHRTPEERKQLKRKPFEGVLKANTNSKIWDDVEEVPEGCSGWIEFHENDNEPLMLCEYKVLRKSKGSVEWIEEDMRGLKSDES